MANQLYLCYAYGSYILACKAITLEDPSVFTSLVASLFFGLTVSDVHIAAQTLIVAAHPTGSNAVCPHCGQASSRVHSSYTRSPCDLPMLEYTVRLMLHVRRFRCANPACSARTFAERVGDYLPPYAQRTSRLQNALQQLGLALGGAAGARASKKLGMASSRYTVLRLVRLVPAAPIAAPRVLGVDDFAFRKGQHYGTILLDLEQRRPIDLLPDRSATTLETWLKAHPGVKIIARDRGPEYIRGATAGAPDAVQVADRFHLLCNLREALERLLERAHTTLRTRLAATPPTTHASQAAPIPLRRRKRTGTAAKLPAERRTRRRALYEHVRRLYQQGKRQQHIAHELHISAWLVHRFIQADTFPERAPKPPRATMLTPFEPLLHEYWQQGEQTTTKLFRLLQAAGYTGSIYTLRHWIQSHRQTPAPRTNPRYRARYTVAPHELHARVAGERRLPSARRLVWLLLKGKGELGNDAQQVRSLLREEPHVASGHTLAQRFLEIVRQRNEATFDGWIQDCVTSGIQEMANFARGLQQDEAAVRAALSLPWSTGPVEGHITRLKLVKRQMYGRASFDLLRQRVLHPV